jgi:hypothetical protein
MSSVTRRALPPGPLYHYTNVHGLKGIMDCQTLWATNIRYLNDSQEFDYAVWVANRVICQRAEAASNQWEKELLTFLSKSEPPRAAPEVFVTSFSEDGDLLSQWRGYCPNADGYSIGFVAEKLRNEGDVQGFGLARCLYDDESQRNAIEDALDKFMESGVWNHARENPEQDDSCQAVSRDWRDRFLQLAPIIKHWGFKEEREWRLISAPIPWGDPRCLVRVGRSMLIPYVTFNLVATGLLIPVQEIIVGPTPHMWLAMQAAGSLLHSRRPSESFGEVSIRNSQLDFCPSVR